MVPLDPEAHAKDLYAGTHGKNQEFVSDYLFDGPFPNQEAFTASLRQKAESQDMVFFAILDNQAGKALGYASYRIEPPHRVIEVGNILFTPCLQRTVGATEAMYLMARYIFDDLPDTGAAELEV